MVVFCDHYTCRQKSCPPRTSPTNLDVNSNRPTKHFCAIFFRTSAIIFFTILLSQFATARPITLAWDPNPEPSLKGYRIYLGTVSGTYSEITDIGNTTTTTLTALVSGQQYYIAIAAYGEGGLESSLSEEVSFRAPLCPAPDTPRLSQMDLIYVDGVPSLRLTVRSPSDRSGQVWVSEDLVNWEILSTFDGTATPLTVTDLEYSQSDQRYYRLSYN